LNSAGSADSIPRSTRESRRFFAVTAPGLEPVTAEELQGLGANDVRVTRGGVGFAGPLELGFRANLWLRSAVAVRLRLARFHVPSERLLAKRAAEVDWSEYLAGEERAELLVSLSRSRLAHAGRVAEVMSGLVPAVVGEGSAAGRIEGAPSEPHSQGSQRVYVRIIHDTCTLSLDMSGELLHRRGYRQEVSRGPLRETLAAALILASRWDPSTPFVDPMCGSGTLPIEAALLAMRVAPGRNRAFACERWPAASPAVWERLRAEARAAALPAPPAPIGGADHNAGAVGVARRNAERAGVQAHLVLDRRSLAEIEPPPGTGLVLTNPPYGRRVTEVRALEGLYADLGQVLAERFAGWQAAVVSADPRLDRRIELPRLGEIEFRHGGLRCRLVRLDTRPKETRQRVGDLP
jgi:putative N6-adenine-specific DNA methylase